MEKPQATFPSRSRFSGPETRLDQIRASKPGWSTEIGNQPSSLLHHSGTLPLSGTAPRSPAAATSWAGDAASYPAKGRVWFQSDSWHETNVSETNLSNQSVARTRAEALMGFPISIQPNCLVRARLMARTATSQAQPLQPRQVRPTPAEAGKKPFPHSVGSTVQAPTATLRTHD